MLTAGEHYPHFDLPAENGSSITLDGLVGSWFLVYWYPRADTPGCTAQAEGLRNQIEVFDDLGCRVLGASFDPIEVNALFRDKYRLPFNLLTDAARVLALGVGAVEETTAPAPSRIAHLVDPDGIVVMAYRVDDPGFFAEQVLDDLEGVIDLPR